MQASEATNLSEAAQASCSRSKNNILYNIFSQSGFWLENSAVSVVVVVFLFIHPYVLSIFFQQQWENLWLSFCTSVYVGVSANQPAIPTKKNGLFKKWRGGTQKGMDICVLFILIMLLSFVDQSQMGLTPTIQLAYATVKRSSELCRERCRNIILYYSIQGGAQLDSACESDKTKLTLMVGRCVFCRWKALQHKKVLDAVSAAISQV